MMPRRRDDRDAAGAASPKAPMGDCETSDTEATTAPRIRLPTVFDAVAGRLSTRDDVTLYAQTDGSEPQTRAPRATRHTTRNATLAPEEALFKRKQAPLRWPHHDIYMAHERDFPDEGRDVLPSSDLVKAVHSYASHFYDALGNRGRRETHFAAGRNISERSMDETALLALGILLEEAGREVLGASGDMVFTEEEEVVPEGDEGARTEGSVERRDDLEPEDMANLGLSSGSEKPSGRGRKRRKVSSDDD